MSDNKAIQLSLTCITSDKTRKHSTTSLFSQSLNRHQADSGYLKLYVSSISSMTTDKQNAWRIHCPFISLISRTAVEYGTFCSA